MCQCCEIVMGSLKMTLMTVDDVDDIVDTEDIVNTTGELNFSISYISSLVLSRRSMT